jgi:glycosyltransferase involved in cell wall biosynthesis
MRVLVTASARFALTDDGTLWTPNASLDYRFWSRYLDVFDQVHLCVRSKLCAEPPREWIRASGPGIQAVPLPDFYGPQGLIRQYLTLWQIIRGAINQVDAIQLRIPCPIGRIAWSLLPSRRPYGVEVVADPYDVFAPGSVQHPLRPFFRWYFPRVLRQQCAKATAALYVTRSALQQRYPCPAYSVGVSNVYLPASVIVPQPRPMVQEGRPIVLVFVGTMAQLYKAPDVLIQAVATCVQSGLDLKLVMVGDGQYRPQLEAQASKAGLGDRVVFRGQLSDAEAVRAELDAADLFVLPSYQEGLPRAMVEAMGRALPCVGSSVGGIPELISAQDIVPPGDADALAQKIREIVTDPQRMARMSAANLERAAEYEYELLRSRRIAFYQYVAEQTAQWLQMSQRGIA